MALNFEIESICQSIDLKPDYTLSFLGKQVKVNVSPADKNLPKLNELLHKLIYERCYCRLEHTTVPSKLFSGASVNNMKNTFYKQLVASNLSVNTVSKFWNLYQYDASQQKAYLEKNNEICIIHPNECFPDNHEQPEINLNINLSKEKVLKGNAFYFIFGNEPSEKSQEHIVRFYIGIKPKGAASLVKLITKYFNEFRVPFQFKLLKSAEDYTRLDTSVLYLGKRHYHIGYSILNMIYKTISVNLFSEVPLFTRQLRPGIGFAENPKSGHSFGYVRTSIIAQTIITAFKNEIEKEKWPQLIMQAFKENYFDIDNFYLDADSKQEYFFDNVV